MSLPVPPFEEVLDFMSLPTIIEKVKKTQIKCF